MTAFEMTAEAAVEYYRRRAELGALTEEQCVQILLQMAAEGLINSIETSDETTAEYVDRISKEQTILDLRENKDAKTTETEGDSGQAGTAGN